MRLIATGDILSFEGTMTGKCTDCGTIFTARASCPKCDPPMAIQRCTTHHAACACREWASTYERESMQTKIAQLTVELGGARAHRRAADTECAATMADMVRLRQQVNTAITECERSIRHDDPTHNGVHLRKVLAILRGEP